MSVAIEILIAISGLKEARQLINADRVFRVTLSFFAASVTEIPSGFIISFLIISPGCVGFLFVILKYPSVEH